ncbi:myeloid-associated differentiation marker-like [Moschus berezovskii]|uniref:myeloid-associated differentiation marker-like n=1 Tax=Moschus berezovskii TaxID=68408 RepID=UPI002443C973|nr:myeloid-associated differentiation marker-like [Moschus berezovskii]
MSPRSTSPDRDSSALVWFRFRLLQLFSSRVAFWLVAYKGFRECGVGYRAVDTWAMLIWFLSLPRSLTVVIVELCYIQPHFRFLYHMPLTDACFAAHVCLSRHLLQSIRSLQFSPYDPFIDRVRAARSFTYITCFLYGVELSCTWNCYKLKDLTCAVYTTRGLRKVLETIVACVIFAFISNTSRHPKEPAHGWCLAIYYLCFAPAAVATLLNLDEEIEDKPEGFWDVYMLRLTHCSSHRDYRPAVAILTAIDLLIYGRPGDLSPLGSRQGLRLSPLVSGGFYAEL